MKITITNIEASAEDLRANRTLAESISTALGRIANMIVSPVQPVHRNFNVKDEAEKDVEDEAEKDDTD